MDIQPSIIRGLSGLEEPNSGLWIEPEVLMAGEGVVTGMGPDDGADPGVELSVMIITSADFGAHGQSCLAIVLQQTQDTDALKCPFLSLG